MAALNTIAREWADEIREGIAWVIIWKTGRSWNAEAVWLNPDDDTFELEDLDTARKILEQDPNAVMLNGYYCGHLGENMTAAELAAGIRWHYENGYNMLNGSTAFPPEPLERPADLPADLPWYGKATSAEPDPYIFDGYMSVEDFEHMHELMDAERQREEETPPSDGIWHWCGGLHVAPGQVYINGQPFDGQIRELKLPKIEPPEIKVPRPIFPELRSPPSMELTITPDTAVSILDALRPAVLQFVERVTELARRAWEFLAEAARKARKFMAQLARQFTDAMLHGTTAHPKWWHLYKHAKKYRVRKKYKRLLQREFLKALAAGTG